MRLLMSRKIRLIYVTSGTLSFKFLTHALESPFYVKMAMQFIASGKQSVLKTDKRHLLCITVEHAQRHP